MIPKEADMSDEMRREVERKEPCTIERVLILP